MADTHAPEMPGQEGTEYEDKAELDDLIAVLKSGEFFERRRGRRLSGISTTSSSGATPRNSRVLEFSRDRRKSSQASIADSTKQENS